MKCINVSQNYKLRKNNKSRIHATEFPQGKPTLLQCLAATEVQFFSIGRLLVFSSSTPESWLHVRYSEIKIWRHWLLPCLHVAQFVLLFTLWHSWLARAKGWLRTDADNHLLLGITINGLDDGIGGTLLKLINEKSLEGILACWQMGARIQNFLTAQK